MRKILRENTLEFRHVLILLIDSFNKAISLRLNSRFWRRLILDCCSILLMILQNFSKNIFLGNFLNAIVRNNFGFSWIFIFHFQAQGLGVSNKFSLELIYWSIRSLFLFLWEYLFDRFQILIKRSNWLKDKYRRSTSCVSSNLMMRLRG